ncbi:MAG: ABC transporter substrate-binding protein [Candidatus Bathyarchaeota archaeon]|nr:ABC transporter substrate-binding protein [Candidatus Bathyarchaeota archaeon]
MFISKKAVTVLLILALAASMIAPLTAVKAQSNSLFSVTIIAPGNANLLRRQWSQVFASNLQQLGIDAKVVYLDWTSVYDRVFTPSPEYVGKTYGQGGYDIMAVGWTPGLLPEPRQLYYGGDPAFFAPSGQNYYLWNNAESNDLLDRFITSTDNDEKASVLKQWQQLYFNEMPASQIMYQKAPVVVNPAIGNLYTPPTGGEGWLYFNAQPYPQLLTRSDGKTSITYCATGEISDLNPPESNSWYDTIVWMPIFNGLAEAWPTLSGLSDLEVPSLLTSWSHSADGFTWTFNCRHGVTWHDGEPFTADDVVFSLWALMNPDTASQFVGYYQSVYGDNVKFTYSDGTSATLGSGSRQGTITATDQYTVTVHLPVLANGKPYGYFEPYLLAFTNNIIPKHILENIAPADWATSPFNTGQGSMTIKGKTYTGPVGTGPYKWVSYDPVAQVVHLERYDNFWNATGLKNMGLFQIKDYYIRFIADKTSALAALKNGEVDMLDYNYQMQTDVPSIDPSWGRVINLDGVGRQEFGYNMRHPVFGTGVDTPLGKSDPSRAAEAAKYVRIAFDYAIPRDLIINNLLAGYGDPGATPMLPTQPFYDNSITARPYDLSQAKHYLELAGYTIPTSVGLTTINLQGILNDTSGAPKPNTAVTLFETTDNSTFPNSLKTVASTTTDVNGFFSFTVSPTEPGTYYYYLRDDSTGEYIFLGSYTVSGAIDITLLLAIVAVVIIVVIIVALIFVRRRRKK